MERAVFGTAFYNFYQYSKARPELLLHALYTRGAPREPGLNLMSLKYRANIRRMRTSVNLTNPKDDEDLESEDLESCEFQYCTISSRRGFYSADVAALSRIPARIAARKEIITNDLSCEIRRDSERDTQFFEPCKARCANLGEKIKRGCSTIHLAAQNPDWLMADFGVAERMLPHDCIDFTENDEFLLVYDDGSVFYAAERGVVGMELFAYPNLDDFINTYRRELEKARFGSAFYNFYSYCKSHPELLMYALYVRARNGG